MQPESLLRSLPHIDLVACRPAVLTGYTRTFDIAFPNDGSQADKAYYDVDGQRPETVLLCNVVPDVDAWTNGICIPVDPAALDVLRDRERRYDLIEATERVASYPGVSTVSRPVGVFVGKSEFTKDVGVSRGVLSAAYLETVRAGAAHWDRTAPGFEQDFARTTRLPPADRVKDLTRVDK